MELELQRKTHSVCFIEIVCKIINLQKKKDFSIDDSIPRKFCTELRRRRCCGILMFLQKQNFQIALSALFAEVIRTNGALIAETSCAEAFIAIRNYSRRLDLV